MVAGGMNEMGESVRKGLMVGNTDGVLVGFRVGIMVGGLVGVTVGMKLGTIDGLKDGLNAGSSVGLCVDVGWYDGNNVDGTALGLIVVGDKVGFVLGDALEGSIVG